LRVLILMPRAPYPADHGAALRNFHILKWLGARHEVALFAFGDPTNANASDRLGEHAASIDILPFPRRSRLARLHDLVVSDQPDLTRRLWSAELVARLSNVLKRQSFDIVQIEGLEMASAWQTAASGHPTAPRTRVVLDDHNAEYVLQESAARASLRHGALPAAAYSLVQAGRLRRYERHVARAVDGVIAVSMEDQASLLALDPTLRTTVVTNGVDPDYFRPGARAADGPTALFIGKLDYRPNVDAVEWLADDIWPRVRVAVPTARLLVVGRDPTPRLARLAGRPGVEVIGPVLDERPWFDRADVLLVPMRMGGGVRLKVVQAMAMGIPVVATGPGVAGMAVQDGVHYLRGDTAREIVARVVQAFGDPGLRQALRDAGQRLAHEQYDWRVILPRLDAFYEELIGATSVPAD